MQPPKHTIPLDQAVRELKANAKTFVFNPLEMKPCPPHASRYVWHDGFEYKINFTRTNLYTRTIWQLSAAKILLDVAIPPSDAEFNVILKFFSSKPPDGETPSPLNRSRQAIWLGDL